MSRNYERGVLYVNDHPVAHAGPGGQAYAPEECWVNVAGQKVKQNFINHAKAQDLKATCTKSFYNGYPLATIKSYTSTSYGDESSEGGVKSGTKQARMKFMSASPNVFYEGSPVTFHGNKVVLNDQNSEQTTWIQPSTATTDLQDLESMPIENLPEPKALNIELIRDPKYAFDRVVFQQLFYVQHEETRHRRYNTFGVFTRRENHYLWHDPRFRQGHYQVYELYDKMASGLMVIPLGRIKSVDKDDLTPSLKLIPLTFKRYDDVQKSAEYQTDLYKDSYIYIFKDGYLWREFEINQLGKLLEVDLKEYYLESARVPKGHLKQGILLPIEDHQGKHEFKIAISRIRWTWEYIGLMGGVDPKDPRFSGRYRVLRNPDSALIEKRLQLIDIHGLINEGEACLSIPQSQTEADLLNQNQACLPPGVNRQWIIEKEYLNLSPGQTKYLKDLYWAQAVSDENIPDFDNQHEYKHKKNHITGGAVFIIHDPLGCLYDTAKLIKERQDDFESYAELHGDEYTLGLMVNQMKELLSKDEYAAVTRESERHALVTEFERRRNALNSFLYFSLINLKHWFYASFAQGQWLDFDYVPEREFEQEVAHEIFTELVSSIIPCFALTEEGRLFLKEELGNDGGEAWKLVRAAERYSKFKVNPRLASDLGSALSFSLRPNSESLKKISDFMQKALGRPFEASLQDLSLNEGGQPMQNPHHMAEKHSGYIHVSKMSATIIKTRPYGQQPTKKQTLFYRDIPFHELHRLATGTGITEESKYKNAVNKLAVELDKDKITKASLTVLAVFNLNQQLTQIQEMIDAGEVSPQTISLLYQGALRDAIFVAEQGFRAYYVIADSPLTKKNGTAGKVVQFLGVAGAAVGGMLDFKKSEIAKNSGNYGMMVAYDLSLVSNIIIVYSALKVTGLFALRLNLYAFLLSLLAMYLMKLYEKNKIQNWILEGYWGRTKMDIFKKPISLTTLKELFDYYPSDKAKTIYSIEQFHYMMTVTHLISVERGDLDKYKVLTHPRARISLPRYLPEPEELRLTFIIPFDEDCHLKTHFWVQRKDGLILLEDTCYRTESRTSEEGGLSFFIYVKKFYFESSAYLGKILIECYEIKSQALLGKDAYALYYEKAGNEYQSCKIVYEQTDKFDKAANDKI